MGNKVLHLLVAGIWIAACRYLFQASGTLADPSGDGPITKVVREMTNDGPIAAVYGILVLVVAYGGAILIARRGFSKKVIKK